MFERQMREFQQQLPQFPTEPQNLPNMPELHFGGTLKPGQLGQPTEPLNKISQKLPAQPTMPHVPPPELVEMPRKVNKMEQLQLIEDIWDDIPAEVPLHVTVDPHITLKETLLDFQTKFNLQQKIRNFHQNYIFYFHQLNKIEQDLYKKLYQSAIQKDEGLCVDEFHFSKQQFIKVRDAVLYDHPELWWLEPYRMSFAGNEVDYVELLMQKRWHISEMEKKFQEYQQIIHQDLKEYSATQKLFFFQSFMAKTQEYKDEQFTSKNIYGALVNKKAICLGFAKLFKYLCDYYQIKCIVVDGQAFFGNKRESHAWNMVEIDSFWYHVDPTWNLHDCYNSRYLCVDDRLFFKDHQLNSNYKFEKCDSMKHNYFQVQKRRVYGANYIERFKQVIKFQLIELKDVRSGVFFDIEKEITKEEIQQAVDIVKIQCKTNFDIVNLSIRHNVIRFKIRK
uniref:Transglutaminase-like superfamily protein n=1 Tax=Trepomonas sp. PC1 TaxID=1076344 RepID=A0A146KIQ5_9EUKA|eukprot:JAP96533.1 Transglutaminase-like superfamily protein [Trepomonas sp. PC1]